MPPSKRRQSNAMLYTLIVFIGLFIVATTAAVIYYVKAEELRTQNQEIQQRMDGLARSEEYRMLGSIVGTPLPGESQLGTMVTYLDRMLRLVEGGPVPVTSAQVKVSGAVRAVRELLAQAQDYIALPVTADPNAAGAAADPNGAMPVAADPNAGGIDPNRIALTAVVRELMGELGHTIEQRDGLQQQLIDLRQQFDDAITDMQSTKNALTAQVSEYRQEVDQIKTDYNDLKALVKQNSDEQIRNLLDERDAARNDARQYNADLLKTQAELNVAQNRLSDALKEVNAIKPPPDQEAVAFKPDGKIILVDDAAGVVRINLGSDDRVYRGLTFAVYDEGAGIPRDGKPKAQVEVFIVDQKVCAARIMSSDRKNPVSTDDLVANLIWDPGRENQFVVAGDFDLDNDGTKDYDAIGRIETLIRKWGGNTTADVSARTDYVILGTEPMVPPEPTLEQITADPTTADKFNAAQARLARYEQVRQRAESLWIPIFSFERFLYFTGYAAQVGKPGAF
jgi:hypothetical protein